jgi:hypothetical protein
MDLIEIAYKQLREHPALMANARRNAGMPTMLGTVLMGTLRCSRAKAEHAVGEAVARIEKEPGNAPG